LGTPEPLARAYFVTARALNAQGRASLAIFFGKRAIAQTERQRRYFSGEDERLDRGFLLDKIAMYRTVADWLMQSGRIDEGLEVLQLLKAQELYDFTSRAAAWDTRGNGPALDDLERTLDGRYAPVLRVDTAAGARIDRLRHLQLRSRITAAERQQLDALLKRAEETEGARSRRIRQFIAANEHAVAGTAVAASHIDAKSLEHAIASAPAGSAIAIYVLTENELRLLIATRQTQLEIPVAVNAHDLQRRIGRFLDPIGQRAPMTQPRAPSTIHSPGRSIGLRARRSSPISSSGSMGACAMCLSARSKRPTAVTLPIAMPSRCSPASLRPPLWRRTAAHRCACSGLA
jgi:hypothetical protein